MAEWPLTGRRAELGRLVGWLDPVGGRGAIITGAAGAGKTRLAREALAPQEARGRPVRWLAGALSTATVPLAALDHLLVGGWEPADLDPLGLLRRAVAELTALGDGDQLVLGVDDAHLLDDASATVIHRLLVSGAAAVVATVRANEPAPDPIVALWKDEHLPRLELGTLTRQDTEELLAAVLGGPVDRLTFDRLWTLTLGNPLFLEQVLGRALADGMLVRRGPIWSWSGGPVLGVGLTELIRARIDELAAEVREVLELLTFGEPLELETLIVLTGADAVAGAEQAGLVSVDPLAAVAVARLAQPLYGEVVRALTPPPLIRDRCRVLADALGGRLPRSPADVIRRAALLLEAGGPGDAGLFAEAASLASTALDYGLAERLARAAVDEGGGFRAGWVLANALVLAGRFEDAEQQLRALENVANTDEERARVAHLHAGTLFWTLGRTADSEAVLSRADSAITDDAARQVLRATGACFMLFSGRPVEAAECAAGVLAAPAAPPSSVLWAAAGGGLALGLIGRSAESVSTVARGWEAMAECAGQEVHGMGALLDAECSALCHGGRLAEARRRAEELQRWATEKRTGAIVVGVGAAMSAQAELAAGRAHAADLFAHALALLGDTDPGGWFFRCHLGRAEAHALAGDATSAASSRAEAIRSRSPGHAIFRSQELLVDAWVAHAAGNQLEAVSSALDAAAAAATMGLVAAEARALHMSLLFGGEDPVTTRLRQLERSVDNDLVAAYADHADAVGGADPHALVDVGERLLGLGFELSAADALARAAIGYERAGSRAETVAASARARRLVRACGAAPTPAIAAAPPPPELSTRERQVAELAAQGEPNKDIARQLNLSVRTVENHLLTAYAKLGVSRAQLAEALAALDLDAGH